MTDPFEDALEDAFSYKLPKLGVTDLALFLERGQPMFWLSLIRAADDEYLARVEGSPYEGDGEYYQEMKATRHGFVTGIAILRNFPPDHGETQESYIERIETAAFMTVSDVLAFVNTLRRHAGMRIRLTPPGA